MKSTFSLYAKGDSDLQSTIFDAFSGRHEVRLTKALAFMIHANTKLLKAILKLPQIHAGLKEQGVRISFGKTTSVDVGAEKTSTSGKRADIVIKINKHGKPIAAILIEAKGVDTTVNAAAIQAQIIDYITPEVFPDLCHYSDKIVPVVLTKHEDLLSDIPCITWTEIIDCVSRIMKKNNDLLLTQFYKFITGIGDNMEYFEEEVLSIPAGGSIDLIEKYGVYECPASYRKHKKPLFVTFRDRDGGRMKKLWRVDKILEFNPSKKSDCNLLEHSNLKDETKTRVINYLAEQRFESSEDSRIYVLSMEETIDLQHKPKPKRNNSNIAYYTLSEIISKEIVSPSSQTRMH